MNRLCRGYRKSANELSTRIKKFHNNPTPDNVHDLRTTIRRLEAIIELFPRKIRNQKNLEKYLSACRKLFRATTPVRDLDVVRQSIENYSGSTGSGNVTSIMQIERNHLISNSYRFAEVALRIKPPRISKRDITAKKIKKRQSKIVKKLLAKLQEELPIVLSDFRRVRELHDVRKDCKRLRYILELFPSKNNEDLLKLMQDWQALLGKVRDIDVSEKFAIDRGLSEELEAVLFELRISRDKMLGTFSNKVKLEENNLQVELS